MALFRTISSTRHCLTGLHRIQTTGVYGVSKAHASTQSPFSTFYKPYSRTGPTKKTGIMSAVGGLLACGSAAFLYKTCTDENFSYAPKYNWIFPQANCEVEVPDDWAKCDIGPCFHHLPEDEEKVMRGNRDLELALNDVKPKAMEFTEEAVKAYKEAAEIIKQYMDKAYAAIEQEDLDSPRFEEVWCEIYDLALQRCDKMKAAVAKRNCAWELVQRYRKIVEDGLRCQYTSCNEMLIDAQESLLIMERELSFVTVSKVNSIQSESPLVEQYRTSVENFRQELKTKIKPPDEPTYGVRINENSLVIAAAYKKLLETQKELARAQVCARRVPPKQQGTMC